MTKEHRATEMDTFSEIPRRRSTEGPDKQIQEDEDSNRTPGRKPLVSGHLGLNLFLLGAALVTGEAFNPDALKKAEPQVFIELLMGVSLIWMLWYLLWARKQPDISPHKDHHAGGITVTLGLMVFAVASVVVFIFRAGYLLHVSACTAAAEVISPFIEAPFLALQTFLLWAHSKDCIHKHKVITRSGLMIVLTADLLLWLNAVTEDTIHEEIELEKARDAELHQATVNEDGNSDYEGNSALCRCTDSATCLVFRKGFEILYPFNIEYYLMAGCMVYVMLRNVARRVTPGHHHGSHKLTLRMIYEGGAFGLVLGSLVLIAGVAIFFLYQIWVNTEGLRLTAFLLFYGYHIAVMPLMSICCLAGILVHMVEKRAHQHGPNPSRNLDVVLLVAAAIGQLALSYFSLVAAAFGRVDKLTGNLDLSYSLLTLLEIILQNIFIIEGLHRHPELLAKSQKLRMKILKLRKKSAQEKTDTTLIDGNTSAPSSVQQNKEKKSRTTRAIKEICAFLILCNIMLWVISAFGVHPQFENGVGKQFFGFTAWFVMVNLGQPLSVFYRMHSVVALMELFITE